MELKTLKDVSITDKLILYRAPYDIGVKLAETGEYVVNDESRIRATLPTIDYLLKYNCRIVIVTYVKRPNGQIVEELRTAPHAKALSKLIKTDVKYVNDCIGEKVRNAISELKPKELLMLENTRFYPEEDNCDDDFAKNLTNGCDLIIFDAFPQAHRDNASTTGILKYLPSAAGFYCQKEVEMLNNLATN
jgi:phosphoglycerate kinase